MRNYNSSFQECIEKKVSPKRIIISSNDSFPPSFLCFKFFLFYQEASNFKKLESYLWPLPL